MKKIQVTPFFEDIGLCKNVFRSISEPHYYCNRDTVDGTWYTSTPDYFENDCRIRQDVIIEIIADGKIIALDGNGDFKGKQAFVPSSFHNIIACKSQQENSLLKSFTVTIEEHISQSFTIMACSISQAMEDAKLAYKQEKFVVESSTPTARLMMAQCNETDESTEWKEF